MCVCVYTVYVMSGALLYYYHMYMYIHVTHV